MGNDAPRTALDFTHVLYNDDSRTSFFFALVTLSPILLMACYAVLTIQTRELIIINMWAGQLASEGFNYLLKHIIKQERPYDTLGRGYGFPSSHSQYMGYFSAFLMMHLFTRHRFPPSGYPAIDQLWRLSLYGMLVFWAGSVCYSRHALSYHSPSQIIWGVSIGAMLGVLIYTVLEFVPSRSPGSLLGRIRTSALESRIAEFARLRDGWAVWDDGGREEEWQRWHTRWRALRKLE